MMKKEIEHLPIPKGEWTKEPLVVEQYWPIDDDLMGRMWRNPTLGILCGYVGVRDNHPAFGVDYRDISGIDVHGGLTFSGIFEGSPLWWVGFDCGHAFDVVPHMAAISMPGAQYRNLDYVREQVESLAKQLREKFKEPLAIEHHLE